MDNINVQKSDRKKIQRIIPTTVSNCVLRIDYRERDLLNNFGDKIKPFGDDYPWTIVRENLMLGDIILQWKTIDPTSESLIGFEMICERKSIDDFAASISDGRYKEQKTRILFAPLPEGISKRFVVYFIEGQIPIPSNSETISSSKKSTSSRSGRGRGRGHGHSSDTIVGTAATAGSGMRIVIPGMINGIGKISESEKSSIEKDVDEEVVDDVVTAKQNLIESVEKLWNVNHGHSRITYSTMISAMFSTMIRDNIHVIRVQNTRELAMNLIVMMQKIYRSGDEFTLSSQIQSQTEITGKVSSEVIDDKLEEIGGLISAKRKTNVLSTPEQRFRVMLCQIPGMSTNLAKPIIERFGTMAKMIQEWIVKGDSNPLWLSQLIVEVGKKNPTTQFRTRRIGDKLSTTIYNMLFDTKTTTDEKRTEHETTKSETDDI